MLFQQSPMLFWLALTIAFTGVLWVPYIAELLLHHGPIQALRDPDGVIAHGSAWAQRAKRAHYNAIENLALFAPLAILIHLLGLETPLTGTMAMAYFGFRVGHYAVYTAGVPFVRTGLFLGGFACLTVLALQLFGQL
ncbi:MAPEG family protein [Novosphingobium sp. B 225]|uniref:MAPEG family protein n=1 Tax=Novosphingobium sp. B 225 TaxID=1961849 RepID=UPI000B4A82F7|nr:MAPEG family protein [Novosphingobium sp. B 225]